MTPDREPSLFELVRDPPLRTAAFVAAAAGLVAFGALFLFRGPAAAGVTAALAVLALVFRWTWPVGLYPVAVAYFLFLPDGTPISLTDPSGFTVRYGGFAVADMLLVPAVLAYVVAQYRFLSLAKQAVPFDADSSFGPKAGAVRRPGGLVTDRELKWLVGRRPGVGRRHRLAGPEPVPAARLLRGGGGGGGPVGILVLGPHAAFA
jgi:hypothetical protein